MERQMVTTGFRNFRMTEIPEIGIMRREIGFLLEVMRKMMAKCNNWPLKGTWQILWNEERCEPREVLWCNFMGGKSSYYFDWDSGLQKGAGSTDSDDMVRMTMESVLKEKIPILGIDEDWIHEGVKNVLVLKTMEGKLLVSINVTSGPFQTKNCRNEQMDSMEQKQLRGLLLGCAEALSAVLRMDAIYRLGINGDTTLEKTMQYLQNCKLSAEERELMELAKNLAAEYNVEELQTTECKEALRLRGMLANLRRARLAPDMA